MKTLEEVIKDASHPSYIMAEDRAKIIAAAVREWMREQNEGLYDTIYNLLMNTPPPHALSLEDCRKYTDAILSATPPHENGPHYVSGSQAHAEKRIEILEDREKWQASRIKELEEKLRVKDDELKANYETLNEWMGFPSITDEQSAVIIRKLEEECKRLTELCNRTKWTTASRESNLMIGGRPVGTGISPAEADDIDDPWTTPDPEPLVKPEANKRIEIADPPVQEWRYKLSEPDKLSPNDIHNLVSPSDLATVQKQLEQEREQVAWYQGENSALRVRLEQESKRLDMSGMESWNILAEKAKKYDALREKFPFLPGEEFWVLFQNSITKWTTEKVWFNNDGRLCLNGYRERQNGSILESPTYKASECYPIAEACRNAIKVEE